MKAWLLYSNKDWRLEEVDDPEPGVDEVLVKIKVVQPSITEVVAREFGETPLTLKISGLLAERSPRQAFGHEFSGTVVKAGNQVRHLQVGDRVACLRSSIGCGECSLCRAGDSDMCRSPRSIGYEIPGCLAEYASIPAWGLAKLPSEVNDHEGATLQPLGHCMTTIWCAGLQPDDTLLILGQGVLGLGILQIARSQGVGPIVTTDISPTNVELSGQMGTDHALRADSVDVAKVVREVTGGRGADVVIDTAGGSLRHGLSGFSTFEHAVELVRDGGKIVVAALLQGSMSIDPSIFSGRGLRVIWPENVFRGSESQLLQLMQQRRVVTQPTIRRIVHGLEQVPEAFRITGEKRKYETINPCQVVV